MKRLLLSLCIVGLLGCPKEQHEAEVSLYRVTNAPPTLISELFDTDDRTEIRLSTGVAMGVTCYDSCEKVNENCRGFTLHSADESIIATHEAFRATGQETFVLAAASAGTTSVTVTTACGSKTYRAVAVD